MLLLITLRTSLTILRVMTAGMILLNIMIAGQGARWPGCHQYFTQNCDSCRPGRPGSQQAGGPSSRLGSNAKWAEGEGCL